MFITVCLLIYFYDYILFFAGGGAEGERDKQAPRSALEPDVGLDPMAPGSRPQPKSRVGCSTKGATQAPHGLF